MSPRTRRVFFACALVAWCAATWWLSSRTNPDQDLGMSLPDWLAHGIEYFAGGFCAYGVLAGPSRVRGIALGTLFCVLWGLGDEWHQSYVPGRDSTLTDVLADTVGGGLGTLAHTLFGSASRLSTD